MQRKHALLALAGLLSFGLWVMVCGSAISAAASSDESPAWVQILPDAELNAGPSVQVLEEDSQHLLLEFELPALEVLPIDVGGATYHVLAIEGGGVMGSVGAPMLPTFSRLIAIPDRAGVQIEAQVSESRELVGYRPVPMQPDTGEEFVIDAAAYARQGYGPSESAQIGEPALMRGLRVIPISFQPVQYDPARGTVAVAGRMQVRVAFAGEDLRSVPTRDARPLPQSFDRLFGQLVVNYPGARDGQLAELGTYVLICQDNSSILSALQPLVEWRTRMGYEVHLVTTTQTGSTRENIKAWLQNAYNTWENPPEYITLVGDANGSVAIPCWNETYSGYGGETDHPYVQLDGTDILPDAHIGRISVESVERLALYVEKIVSYESTPFMDDTSWYPRACLVGDPRDSGYSCIQQMQWMKERLRQIGYAQIDTIFSEPFVSGMTTKLNLGDTIFCYRGIMGMSGFTSSMILNLTNGRKMPFAVNLTCDTGSFASGTSRSEAWIRAGNTSPITPSGGIASIGTATTGTHTRYNNCFTFGIWRGALWEGMYRFGEALTRGKLEMYINYFRQEPSYAQRFICWNNLMGDAAGELWTAVPRTMSVSHPLTLTLGTSSITVGVNAGGGPVAGAYVCLWKGAETLIGGYTDESGTVELPITPATPGNLKITVTKHDYRPYLHTISTTQDDHFVGYYAHRIDDDDSGTSSGNNDDLVNPAEVIELPVEAKNFGSLPCTAVTGSLTCDDSYVAVIDAAETFGDIAVGGTAWSADDFDIRITGGAPNGHVVTLGFDFTSESEQWHSAVSIPVVAGEFIYDNVTLTGFGTRVDPGETGQISVRIKNIGDASGTTVTGRLTSGSPWVTVTDRDGSFGTITVGSTGENTSDRFGLSAASDCYPGHIAPLKLALTFSDGAQDTVDFALNVGQASSTDPTGPDLYGYYAFDNTDTSYPQAPTYAWVEIAPNHGGSGTSVGLNDGGPEEGDSHTVDLPFPFTYYGQTFTRATICSNGWISMGATYLTEYRNWNIPGAGAPANMIAVMWDDLYQDGQDQVYQRYDAAGHRYIVQWSRLRNAGSWWPVSEDVEVILYDPAYYPTDTGDGIIVMQYETFNNIDSEQHYCTVGIENGNRDDGLMYTYFNYYNGGAASIGSGRAIKFLPLRIEDPAGASTLDPLPQRLMLYPARPNPFALTAGEVTLRLDLPQASPVRLLIFDAAGRLVRTLLDGRLAPGSHNLTWNGCDAAGRASHAGIYFSVLEAQGQRIARTITMLR